MEVIGCNRNSLITIHCTGVVKYPGTDDILTLSWLVTVKDTTLHGVFQASADEICVEADAHALFLAEMQRLDINRCGHITLTGCSPREFCLELFNIDHVGHIGVRYQVGCHRKRLGTDNFRVDSTVTLSGAFEVDMDYFTQMVHDLASLAIPTIE